MTHEYVADVNPDQLATLEVLAHADPLNDWIFERMRPHLGDRILEVGCGIGTYTTRLMRVGEVVALDPSPVAVERCRSRIGEQAELIVGGVEDLPPTFEERFDSVVCLNVLEHIPDDRAALEAMRSYLRPGGKLLLLVPQGIWLYGSLDRALEHCRRYRRRELARLLTETGFEHDGVPYFNMLGIPGWIIAVKILKMDRFRAGPLRMYRLLMPPFRWFEDRFGAPTGLSLFTIATRR